MAKVYYVVCIHLQGYVTYYSNTLAIPLTHRDVREGKRFSSQEEAENWAKRYCGAFLHTVEKYQES